MEDLKQGSDERSTDVAWRALSFAQDGARWGRRVGDGSNGEWTLSLACRLVIKADE